MLDSHAGPVENFGGFDPGSAANFGFAILSDIEAYFVVQASQGDSRTNIMQAPKVTLFNGQEAYVSDQSQSPFVISVIPVSIFLWHSIVWTIEAYETNYTAGTVERDS